MRKKRTFEEILKAYDIDANKPLYEEIMEAHQQELERAIDSVRLDGKDFYETELDRMRGNYDFEKGYNQAVAEQDKKIEEAKK